MPMIGRPIHDADGNVIGIACSRERVRLCSTGCGRRATKLCDFPLSGKKAGKTCDADLCERCAEHVGPDRDYCPPHARAAKEAGHV